MKTVPVPITLFDQDTIIINYLIIIITTTTTPTTTTTTTRIEDLGNKKGLLLNAKKTKVMVIDKTRTPCNALTLNGQ